MDVDLQDISRPATVEDTSDECNDESTSAYVDQQLHDSLLRNRKNIPSNCPASTSNLGDMAAELSVKKKRKLAFTPDRSELSKICKSQDFNDLWLDVIRTHQKDILPLAGMFSQ